MEKFEYMHLVYSSIIADSKRVSDELNRFGANGWEAFAVRSMSNDELQIFLKRKIHE